VRTMPLNPNAMRPLLACFLLGIAMVSGLTRSRNEASLIATHYNANTAGFAYVGCYRDNPQNRDLPVVKTDSVDMTPKTCNSLCAGYDYFAVQITQCFCGNSYGSVQEPVNIEGKTAIGKWTPGTGAASTTPPSGITSLENGMAQTAYETNTNTLGGVGIVDTLNKYVQEGCYHDCGGASNKIDGGLLCGGLNRNSVYRRPSTMPSSCVSTGVNHGHPLLQQRGLCDPPQGALAPATMPPCVKSDVSTCEVIALAHEDKSYAYSKPWETHHTFQTGHARDNPPARIKDALMPDMLADESYMVQGSY